MEGKILGNRYELIEKIGGGGMAIVYKAKCTLLKRFVAVKILRNEFNNDEEFLKRFQIEAQAAASLSHPNIVSVYDVGREGEIQYIVMELIDGITLKDYIESENSLNWREAINISIQICSAIEHAHKNKIVHRDIKPHNILLTKDGVAKVADFGIARAVTNTTITMVGSTIGSVHYFSPEQARGGFADEKSDLYSLGISLYEMTTGTLPFDGETPVAIALKHLQQNPRPPLDIDRNIPKGVNDIIMKAIRKEQNARYQNANEMLEDLYKVLRNPEGGFVRMMPNENGSTRNVKTLNNGYGNQNTLAYNPNERIGNYNMDELSGTGYGRNNFDNTGSNYGYNNSNQGNDDDGIPYGSNQNKDGKKTKKYALITVGVLLLALLTGFLVSSLGDDDTNIVMKDYEGYTYDKAVEELTKSGWDENKIEREDVKSDEVEEGKIISQNILPEMKLKESDTVKFQVSIGAGDNSIPDLKGLDLNEAKDQLIDLGVDTANIETKYQFSDDVEKDKVIKTEPGAGSNYKDGDKIIIYVSKGKEEVEETQEPEEELVNIPFVEGSTLKDAVSALEAKGLNVSVSPADAQNDAKVISQSPGGGQDVSEGSTVTLTVEASNTPEPKPTPKIIESTSVKVRLPGDIDDDDILLSYTITNNDTGDVFSGQADTTKDQYSPTYELVINDIPEGRYKIDYTFNNQSGGSDNFVAR